MIRGKHGGVGDVPRRIGGSLVAPQIDPVHMQRYFGDLKGFEAVDERVTIVAEYVPVKAVASGTYLERAFWNGNHSGVTEHLPTIWKNGGRRQAPKCLD